MGAWANLTISETTLGGFAFRDLFSASLNGVDSNVITSEILAAAKSTVETVVRGGAKASGEGFEIRVDGIPSVVKKLGGTTTFFDLAAADSDLSGILERAVLHAFRWHYYGQEMGSGGSRFAAKRPDAWHDLVLTVRDFNTFAPMQLVDADDPPTLRPTRSRVTEATANFGSGYG